MMKEQKNKYPFYYPLAILLFMLLSALFWWLLLGSLMGPTNHLVHNVSKGSSSSGKYYSPNPDDYNDLIGRTAPIDSSYIIIDSINNRQIFSNLVNIALKDKTRKITEFASDLKKQYPDESYEITLLDSIVNRLQIKLPDDERENFKKEVKTKMVNDKLLVWDESLFATSDFPMNDPLINNNQYNWYLESIQVQNAWDKSLGNKDIVVAVIDNGFDLNHPELKGKSIKPYNAVDKSTLVSPVAENHGTHVATLAVGAANNSNGLAGVCPECSFMPIKVANSQGLLSSSYIIDGILYAIKNGADVINLSLGMQIPPNIQIPEAYQKEIIEMQGKDEEEFWKELFEYAESNKTICVLAAGNSHVLTGLDPFTRSEKTIKVGAINSSGNITSFSNYGEYNTIYAPGEAIYSAKPNNSYESLDGTSMAAPLVSGFIGLLKSQNKEGDFDQMKNLLMQNTQKTNNYYQLKIKTLN